MSSTSSSSSSIKGSWRNVQVETSHLQPTMYLGSMKGNLEDIGEYEVVEDSTDGDHARGNTSNSATYAQQNKETKTGFEYPITSPVADCGGQKQFGTKCTMNDFHDILGLLRLLRGNNCLENLSKATEREVYIGSDSQNVKKEEYSPIFNSILKELDAIYLGANQDVQTALSPILTVSRLVADLRREMTETCSDGVHKKVHLWSAYPRAFATTENSRGRTRKFYSLHEVTPTCIHIFISSAHVNPVEAVLHSYAQAKGYDHTEYYYWNYWAQRDLKKG